MPLRTMFGWTDADFKPWIGFNGAWACTMLSRLNRGVLSRKHLALLDVHKPEFAVHGAEVRPDHVVAANTASLAFPPPPRFSVSADFFEPRGTDLIVRYEPTDQIVAVVAFAHPDFTATPAGRRAFAVKCARWLQRGTTVVSLNIWLPAELHADLRDVLGFPNAIEWRSGTALSAVVYRVVKQNEQPRLEVWPFSLAVGDVLPTVPLWLEPNLAVPLELELTYTTACQSLRIE